MEQNEVKREKEDKPDKLVAVRLKSLNTGNTTLYSTSGLHVALEDQKYLPQDNYTDRRGVSRTRAGRKFMPGIEYKIPRSVAKKYIGNHLEYV